MEPLILQTFIVINSLMGGFMALVLAFLKKNYPESVKGMGDWAVFAATASVASVFYAMQGFAHHLVSMALPNVLVVIALSLMIRGTFEHFDEKLHAKALYAVVVAASFLFVVTSGKEAFFSFRLMLMSGLFAATLAVVSLVLWRHRKGSFPAHFMLLLNIPSVAIYVLRAVTALDESPQGTIYTFSTIQTLYMGSASFGMLVMCILTILLATERLRKELERLVKFDALTGALSRRSAFELGAEELARSSRLQTSLSVLLMDLDHFKGINDRFGHQVGDRVLGEFVRHVNEVLRRPAAIGRLGGEEFMVLLPDTTLQQAMQVAERIQRNVRLHLADPRVTVSIGVATWAGTDEDTLGSMVGRADAALYAAKHNGRDQIMYNDEVVVPGPADDADLLASVPGGARLVP